MDENSDSKITKEKLTALLEKHFGFSEFRPGQQEAILALLRFRAALAVFPTGGGKSLCYQLPALAIDGVTLVISPLIALMKDQIDFLQNRGIAAARLDSSMTGPEVRDVQNRLRDGTLKILYVAPERFSNERFLSLLQKLQIGLFAVDEAHCISEWGHNFRPDYLKIAETARTLGAERVLALTATATPSVVQDICKAFQIPPEASIVTGFYRPNLSLCLTPVTADKRDALLLRRLQTRPLGPTIVYVTLQKTAERIARLLSEAGLSAEAYHAGMDSDSRTVVQERWMASDTGIVVATIAFGMGIDKSNVRAVYHYNMPKSLESYSQEIGRAGRDGAKSIVEMLASPEDIPTMENFAYGDTPTESALRGLVDDLLAREPEFDISLYELSNRHDLRQLVLRTALTYLELQGVLRQGTPFYAGYEIRPYRPLPEIINEFTGEPRDFVVAMFKEARRGKIWYALNPDTVSEALGQERRRVTRAIEYLEEHGWAEVRAADVRQRYRRLRPTEDAEALASELAARFARHETQEIARLQQVMSLVTQNGCQSNALAEYFGETRSVPCGHCTYCKTKQAQAFPDPGPPAPLADTWDADAFHDLRAAHPQALGDPRQAARFLCGLTSPAMTQAKLSRHALFGAWEARSFREALAWCA